MKRIIYFALILSLAVGCAKEESKKSFDPGISAADIEVRFDTVSNGAGGAIMYYKLPASKEIYAINARYKGQNGEDMLRRGSYLADSLILTGYNVKTDNIPVDITLEDRYGAESGVIQSYTFNTSASEISKVFASINVESGWNGINLTYNVEEGQTVTGIIHIFYMGQDPVNPHNTEPIELLIGTISYIGEGFVSRTIEIEHGGDVNDIVVRVEDAFGNVVGTKTFTGIEKRYAVELKGYDQYSKEWLKDTLLTDTHTDTLDFILLDPKRISYESHDYFHTFAPQTFSAVDEATGLRYLLDGDKKGDALFSSVLNVVTPDLLKFKTFVSKANVAYPDVNDLLDENGDPILDEFGAPTVVNKPSMQDLKDYPTGEANNDEPLYVEDGDNYLVIDLKRERRLALIRLHAFLFVQRGLGQTGISFASHHIFRGSVMHVLPASVTIYGSNDDAATTAAGASDWVELVTYDESSALPFEERWCNRTIYNDRWYGPYFIMGNEDLYESAEEQYMELTPAQADVEKFRYYKIQFNSTYSYSLHSSAGGGQRNKYGHVTFHELEVHAEDESKISEE